MIKTEKNKRKFKLEKNILYTQRKLRNVLLTEFQELITKEFISKFTESEMNLVTKGNKLIAEHLCNDYAYQEHDFFLLKETARIITTKIPMYIRKNIDLFEKAHNIKTMWANGYERNIRGQNFKFNNYD